MDLLSLLNTVNERAPQLGAVLIDWETFYVNFPGAKTFFLSELTQGLMVNQERLIDTLAELPQSEWREQVADFLRTQLAQVLGFASAEKISLRQRLVDLGLDSLMVVELQNRLENGLGVELTAALIFEYPTVEALLDYLIDQMVQKLDNASQDAGVTWSEMETIEGGDTENILDGKAEQLLSKLDTFSNEELLAILADELQPEDLPEHMTNYIDVGSVMPQTEENGTAIGQTNLKSDRSRSQPPATNQFDDVSFQSPGLNSIIDQVYQTLSGRDLPMEQQVAYHAPLDTDPVTVEGKARQQNLGIPSGAAVLSFRHTNDALPHLRHVFLRFVGGWHAALDTPDPDYLWRRLQRVEVEFRDFVIEGAGTGYALMDLQKPGNRLDRWLNGPAAEHKSAVYIGVGIALARQQVPLEPYIADLDPILRWNVVDGYGFTFGMFYREKGIEQLYCPDDLSEQTRHVYYQGLGRSQWFACCGDSGEIADIISRFPLEYHNDMWSGAAFGSTMAGGVNREELEQMRTHSQHHLPALAQGAAFAVTKRKHSGNFLPWNELACQVYWQMSAHDVDLIAQEALRVAEKRAVTDQKGPYQAWRAHIQQVFSEREQNLLQEIDQL
ncbi:DUF1702 family protein [Chloroflexi bacterium TSY]|nr:DUF1702 family protein [Chloroflexi bacterium TSY]